MIVRVGVAALEEFAAAVVRRLDLGDGGWLRLYDSSAPDAAVLATLRLSRPAATLVGSRLVFSPIADAEAQGRGGAAWARFYNVREELILECDVGEEGKKVRGELSALQLTNPLVATGDIVHIKSFALRLKTTS